MTARLEPLARSLTLALLLATACAEHNDQTAATDVTGPLMRPGWNCLSCHRAGNDQNAPEWAAAGTVYASPTAAIDEGIPGVSVLLTDANGEEIHLVTNSVGNFYTATPLASPFTATLEYGGKRKAMPMPPPAGSCNACHAQPALSKAPGRLYAP